MGSVGHEFGQGILEITYLCYIISGVPGILQNMWDSTVGNWNKTLTTSVSDAWAGMINGLELLIQTPKYMVCLCDLASSQHNSFNTVRLLTWRFRVSKLLVFQWARQKLRFPSMALPQKPNYTTNAIFCWRVIRLPKFRVKRCWPWFLMRGWQGLTEEGHVG